MENLKKLRLKNKLTQNELAQKLNVTRTALCEWENGNAKPHVDILEQIADYFGVTIDYLLGREPDSGLIYVHRSPELTEEEQALISAYHRISPELRPTALNVLETLGSSTKAETGEKGQKKG